MLMKLIQRKSALTCACFYSRTIHQLVCEYSLKNISMLFYKYLSIFQQLASGFQLRIYFRLCLYDLGRVVSVIRKYDSRTKERQFEGW